MSRRSKPAKSLSNVTNLSRSIVHEMIVVAVENPNAPLPYDYNTGQIPEKQVKMLGETEEMEPNAEKTITLDLKPGAYLLICNVPGHYAAGMWTPLLLPNNAARAPPDFGADAIFKTRFDPMSEETYPSLVACIKRRFFSPFSRSRH